MEGRMKTFKLGLTLTLFIILMSAIVFSQAQAQTEADECPKPEVPSQACLSHDTKDAIDGVEDICDGKLQLATKKALRKYCLGDKNGEHKGEVWWYKDERIKKQVLEKFECFKLTCGCASYCDPY